MQEKTGCNPFFAIQSFTAPAEEWLLAFDEVAGDDSRNDFDQSFRKSN